MNEAYLELGYPIILDNYLFKQMWREYFFARPAYGCESVMSDSPTSAIEYIKIYQRNPIAMHFICDPYGVHLFVIFE